MKHTPTEELYLSLQSAFDHFNRELFEGELPSVIFTMQRKNKCMGFLSANRWASPSGEGYCHELAINPTYVGKASILSTLQTLAHEQVHLWATIRPEERKCSRSGYHNKVWANKMEEIGLMPSSTGAPGGAKTGQNMSDYPIEGGRFLEACRTLIQIEEFRIPWFDRKAEPVFGYQPTPEVLEYLNTDDKSENSHEDYAGAISEETFQNIAALLSAPLSTMIGQEEQHVFLQAAKSNQTRTKYQCPSCTTNIWGKPNLAVRCETCDVSFVSVG